MRRTRVRKREAVRLEHHPRIAICFNKQRNVCVTSLGRLTPCNRMTNFWARDNNKEDMVAARRSVGSLWLQEKFYFHFDFSYSFCYSAHADNVQSSAALISAKQRSSCGNETSSMFLIVHYCVSRRVINDPSCRLDLPKDLFPFLFSFYLRFSTINASRRSKKHPVFVFFSFHFFTCPRLRKHGAYD